MCIGNCFIKTVYTCGIHFRILCFTCWATRSSWCRTEHDGAALSPRCCWRSDTCPRQIPTLPSHQQPQLGSRFQTAGLGGCWITHTHFIFPVSGPSNFHIFFFVLDGWHHMFLLQKESHQQYKKKLPAKIKCSPLYFIEMAHQYSRLWTLSVYVCGLYIDVYRSHRKCSNYWRCWQLKKKTSNGMVQHLPTHQKFNENTTLLDFLRFGKVHMLKEKMSPDV